MRNWIPGVGLIVAGPIAAALAGAGAGAGAVAGEAIGALVGAGIPEERVKYESGLKEGGPDRRARSARSMRRGP